MHHVRHRAVALGLAVILAGCGGSSESRNPEAAAANRPAQARRSTLDFVDSCRSALADGDRSFVGQYASEFEGSLNVYKEAEETAHDELYSKLIEHCKTLQEKADASSSAQELVGVLDQMRQLAEQLPSEAASSAS